MLRKNYTTITVMVLFCLKIIVKLYFWAKRAAQHNYPPALAFLSNPITGRGKKIKPSLSEMEEWTNKAAALGESHAQYIAAQNKESKMISKGFSSLIYYRLRNFPRMLCIKREKCIGK